MFNTNSLLKGNPFRIGTVRFQSNRPYTYRSHLERNWYKKAVCFILALLFALPTASLTLSLHADAAEAVPTGTASAETDVLPYFEFYEQLANKIRPGGEIPLSLDTSRRLAEGEVVEFTFETGQEGLYGLELTYLTKKDLGKNPTVSVSINGKVPFDEARSVQLTRIWVDENRGKQDAKGNELIPAQTEVEEYQTVRLSDNAGFYGKQLTFPLKKGSNTLRLEMQRGSIQVKGLRFVNEEDPGSYEQVSNTYTYPKYNGEALYFEAENTARKSDATIYPISDATSPAVSPYSPYKIRLNTIGGDTWTSPGQYIQWSFDVPQDGQYQIALKCRQNVNVGLSSYRRIFIDGKVPCSELQSVAFPYSISYQNVVLGGNKPYVFDLKKGTHTLRMEVDLGAYSDILTYANEVLTELNTAYRKIIMLTGVTPDAYRDYEIKKNLPDVMQTMKEQRELLEKIDAYFAKNMTASSSATKVIGTLARQLQEFLDDPYRITARLSQFKSNITALSSWLMSAKSQPLQMDYFTVSSSGTELKRANATTLQRLQHEIVTFFYTFQQDYKAAVKTDKDSITVWVNDGQVATNAITELLDNKFNPVHDFDVNVKLVTASLLMAVVAGKGPDVALTVDSTEAMNYAFRDAVTDLSQFEDVDTITKRFRPSAMTPVRYKDQIFGLPATQTFYMMFYRKDVLRELGIEVPKTWQQVVSAMAALKKNNLEFGLPTDLQSYFMLLFQQGGTLYNKDSTATTLRDYKAIKAFDTWCSYYTDYRLPIAYDADNRFRTGEMPLLISAFATYNTLNIAAPEIQGQWGMASLPGTERADGTVDQSVSGAVTCTIILKNKQEDRCWEFLKWWTSDEIQLKYAQRIEQIMGASARFYSANVSAFEKLAWDTADLEKLKDQAKWLVGVPSVPGSYYTSRHLSNALNHVLYSSGTPSEELINFSQIIDKEIQKKRHELKLD